MPERDYFDLPDEAEPAAPPAVPMEPVRTVASDPYDEAVLPVAHRHIAKSIVAVLIFLLVLGGCAFMILHQIHQDLKPKKPAVNATVQK